VPSRRVPRPDPPPLETDDVTVVSVITAGWTVALVVLVLLRLTGSDVRGWWLGMCGYGIALGLIGIRYCQRRRSALARDRSAGILRRP
jgi:hypothetical protein